MRSSHTSTLSRASCRSTAACRAEPRGAFLCTAHHCFVRTTVLCAPLLCARSGGSRAHSGGAVRWRGGAGRAHLHGAASHLRRRVPPRVRSDTCLTRVRCPPAAPRLLQMQHAFPPHPGGRARRRSHLLGGRVFVRGVPIHPERLVVHNLARSDGFRQLHACVQRKWVVASPQRACSPRLRSCCSACALVPRPRQRGRAESGLRAMSRWTHLDVAPLLPQVLCNRFRPLRLACSSRAATECLRTRAFATARGSTGGSKVPEQGKPVMTTSGIVPG